MSYLTDAEQEEINSMEELFNTAGWKTFMERNQAAIADIEKKAIQAKTTEELYMMKGQFHVLSQIVYYEDTFRKSVEAVMEERAYDAGLNEEEARENAHAKAV